jgi:phthiodiolone/phenolphthiodiolone dimycocerosates ketoreductase
VADEPVGLWGKRHIVAEHAQRAGRPIPECALHIATLIGESRSHAADLMDRDPLGKLVALTVSADIWAKYGLTHSAGDAAAAWST